jgi:hypothetical protein
MLISNSIFTSNLCGYRVLLVGAIATLGVLSGYLPGLSSPSFQGAPQLTFNAPAQAQAISEEELDTYIRAAYDMEILRRRSFREIRAANNGTVPDISCNSSEGLADNVAPIVRDFCDRSEVILNNYGMNSRRFNQIYTNSLSDPNLAARIQRRLQELSPRRPR